MPMVTFYSDQFSDTPAPDAINEMLGRDVCEWLRAAVAEAEPTYETSVVIAEDYGYGFWVIVNRVQYWVTATAYPLEHDTLAHEWLVQVAYEPGCLFLMRRRAQYDVDVHRRLVQIVHERLTTDTTHNIRNIQWWAQDVAKGTPTPEPPTAF